MDNLVPALTATGTGQGNFRALHSHNPSPMAKRVELCYYIRVQGDWSIRRHGGIHANLSFAGGQTQKLKVLQDSRTKRNPNIAIRRGRSKVAQTQFFFGNPFRLQKKSNFDNSKRNTSSFWKLIRRDRKGRLKEEKLNHL